MYKIIKEDDGTIIKKLKGRFNHLPDDEKQTIYDDIDKNREEIIKDIRLNYKLDTETGKRNFMEAAKIIIDTPDNFTYQNKRDFLLSWMTENAAKGILEDDISPPCTLKREIGKLKNCDCIYDGICVHSESYKG